MVRGSAGRGVRASGLSFPLSGGGIGLSGGGFEDELRDFLVGRETVQGGLREEELPVDGDLESASAPLHEGHAGAVERALEFSSQTGCLRGVVSLGAVLDLDVHLGLAAGVFGCRSCGPVHGTGHRRRGTRSPFPGLDGCTWGPILPRLGIESEMLGESHDTAEVVREHFKGGRLGVRHPAAAGTRDPGR